MYGEQFPVYISSATIAADGLPDITDDIYDGDNYLSLISDDDIMWYALVEHLAHQAELLQEDNNKYNDDLVAANEEMDKLNCKLADEIKARQGYEESLNQLREELTAADNEINELEETLREVNKKCSEYVSDIDKLEVDNKRLSERVKTLVIEKTNRDDVAEKVSDPKEKLDMDTLQLLTKITELENENEKLEERLRTLVCKECIYGKGLPLNTRIAQLEEKLKSTETELTTAMNANSILKTQIAALKDEKRKEENKEFTITINVKKHDDNETDINVYKTEIDKLTREVDHLRKENDKIYSILNDAVKVVRNRNKQ